MGSPGEKLSAYVSRLKRENQGWLFVHGHWWVKKAWGISHVPDPATPASELDLREFFAPRQVSITAVSGEQTSRVDRDILIPGIVNEVISPREAFIRVRLDVPAATQADQIASALAALQSTLPFIPEKLARDRALPLRAQLWLRAWDAKKAGVAAPAAREKIARSLRAQSERIGDARFAKDVRAWSLDRFNRIKSDGGKLIESTQCEAFLSAMVTEGLNPTSLKSCLQPVWTVGWK
jgi:hypothetical protein